MDDDELAESVAKRKQAEAHGYVAPAVIPVKTRSAFGDGLGGLGGDDDEDDFFSLAKKPANNEDEDFGDETGSGPQPSGSNTPDVGGKSNKRKAVGERECSVLTFFRYRALEGGNADDEEIAAKRVHKKKVKIALGPDGLPI